MTLNVSFSSNFENSEGLRISESLLQLNQVVRELKKSQKLSKLASNTPPLFRLPWLELFPIIYSKNI